MNEMISFWSSWKLIVFLCGRQLSKFNTLQERKTTHIFLIVAKRFRGCRCESNRPALKWRVIWKYAYNPFNTDETLCLGLKYSRIWSLLHGIRNYLQSYKPFLGNIQCGFIPRPFFELQRYPAQRMRFKPYSCWFFFFT